ncbi:MAG: hypothetical protein M3552_19400 [Planctomycetota bacterium]|nr:hypothetical protein [Planctomycetaceae bacterium]MDQ3332784.1 hypothetical protein [Planctomycetota bacterium]
MTLENGILFIACLLVASGVLTRRAGRRRAATETPNVAGRADAVVRRVNACEARLYDYSREIDATYQTRAATLQTLTDEADKAATRLEAALKAFAAQGELAILPFDERSHAARLLKQAGYSDEQIAKLLDRGDEASRRAA